MDENNSKSIVSFYLSSK